MTANVALQSRAACGASATLSRIVALASSGRLTSLELKANTGHDLPPDLDLFRDRRQELIGRPTGWRRTVGLKLFGRVLRFQELPYLAIDAAHDRRRQPLRTEQPVPENDLVPRHAGLSYGWHVRHGRDPLRRRNGNCAQPSRPY